MNNSDSKTQNNTFRLNTAIPVSILIVIFIALTRTDFLSPLAKQWLTDGAWTVASFIGALACYRAAQKQTGDLKKAWLFLSYAHVSWFVGIVIWSYLELIARKSTPFPALSDYGFMLFAPLFMIGLYFFGEKTQYRAISRQLSKLIVIVVSLVVMHGYLLLPRIVDSNASWLYVTVAITYPVFYMSVIIYGLLTFIHLTNNVSLRVFYLVFAALATHAITVSLYAYSLLGHEYKVGHYLDVFWLVGFALIFLAAEQSIKKIQNNKPVHRLVFLETFDSLIVPILIVSLSIILVSNIHVLSREYSEVYIYMLSALIISITIYQLNVARLERILIKNLASSELLLEKTHSEFTQLAMVSSEKLEDEISRRKKSDEDLRKHHALLQSITKAQDQFIRGTDSHEFFERLLDMILEITDSEYGFIGEVLYQNGNPYLKTYAITNIAWNEETKKFYEENLSRGLEFYNLETLFGYTLKHHEVVISNDPLNDERAGGIPEGHPPLKTYLGVPLMAGDNIIGMVGVANREKGYSEKDVALWQILFKTCSNLVRANRIEADRTKAENQLIEAKNEAEKANQAKSEFISHMSHELRTPLNAIIGFSQIMEMDESLNDSQLDSVNEIHQAGGHLLSLINDLLDIGRIESDKLKYEFSRVNVQNIISESLGYIDGMARKKNISINYIPGKLIDVNADNVRLKQVFINILSNAVKYNKENGSIGVTVMSDDQNCVIKIEDTGIGIASGMLDRVFYPFDRLEADKYSADGVGIGLYISKNILDEHNAKISVASVEGEGSTFTITIPRYV